MATLREGARGLAPLAMRPEASAAGTAGFALRLLVVAAAGAVVATGNRLPTPTEQVDEQLEGHGTGKGGAAFLELQHQDGTRELQQQQGLPMASFVDSFAAMAPSTQQATPAAIAEILTDQFRFSVVRIQTIESVFDWFQPFASPRDRGAIGSGFAVELESQKSKEPIFVTNAHVVQNAHTVRIQLPVAGQEDFGAYVPLIYEDFDLALVRLLDPEAFTKFLQEQNCSLKVLPIRALPVKMGLEVAALGFPLGSSSLKLSRGVIAGTEEVEGRLVFQSTAPISPGSSGGPLFMMGSSAQAEVVGANFAAASDSKAQNANYVVPAVHIRQLLHEFWRQEQEGANQSRSSESVTILPAIHEHVAGDPTKNSTQPSAIPSRVKVLSASNGTTRGVEVAPASLAGDVVQRIKDQQRPARAPPRRHVVLRAAPVEAVVIEANEALYENSGGCTSGVFISKVEAKSALYASQPPVPTGSFITKVDEVELDSFGMGRVEAFMGDPIPFESIMALHEKIEDPVTLSVCHNGSQSKHVVSMVWNATAYEMGIREVEEPSFHPELTDFEYFADVAVMPMTVNHVAELLKRGSALTVGRWLLRESLVQPRLMIVYIKSGTYASRVLSRGMVLQSVNGVNVSTLSEFRQHFDPEGEVWRLETERGILLEVNFTEALLAQLAEASSGPQLGYLNTPAFMAATRRHNLVPLGPEDGPQLLKSLLAQAYAGGFAKGLHAAAEAKGNASGLHSEGAAGNGTASFNGTSLNGSAGAGAAVLGGRVRRGAFLHDAAAPPDGAASGSNVSSPAAGEHSDGAEPGGEEREALLERPAQGFFWSAARLRAARSARSLLQNLL